MVALHVNVPDVLQPGTLNVQFTVPLACVSDWNVPDNVLVEKELPVIGIDVPASEVVVAPVGQLAPRFGKLTP